VSFDFLPKQQEFLNSPYKYTAFIGGIGSGKTFAGCVKAYIEGVYKGRPGMIVAPTFPMLRDVTQTEFLNLLDTTGVTYVFNKAENKIFVNGTVILFRSAEKPERLRGPNLSWVYLDEAALMRGKIWEIVIGRLRVGVPKGWVTTTPAGFNWVYRYFGESADDNYKMYQSATRENIYLPEDYIRDLEAAYTGEFARQELDGEFTLFEGLVYSEFSLSRHVTDFVVPEGWTLVRAIDWGYTNPFVCLFGAVDEDGRLYIYDEHYESKRLIKHHAEKIKQREGNFSWTVADHDAQDNAELRKYGIPTINAKKDVIEGIQKVKARLVTQGDGRPRLFIHPRCENLIKEMQAYRWAESKDGVNEKEEPVKEFDHAMDALRYMVMKLDRGTGRVANVPASYLGL
jgi:phage terminase large subunit